MKKPYYSLENYNCSGLRAPLNFLDFSTIILAIGAELNSHLLLRESIGFVLWILTDSFAWRVRASLKTPVIFISNWGSSFGWSNSLCLYRALFSSLFFNLLTCSAPRILADLEDSPSYTLFMFLSLQVLHLHWYPTFLVLQGYFGVFSLFVHKAHFFSLHFSFLNGFLLVRIVSILTPPVSTILIRSSEFRFSSASLFLSSFANLLPGVGGTNKMLVYFISDFVFFHQLRPLFCQNPNLYFYTKVFYH